MQVVHLQYPSFAFSFAACVGRDGKVLFHHAIFRGEFAAASFPPLLDVQWSIRDFGSVTAPLQP